MFTEILHNKFVYNRRMNLISDIICDQLKNGETILDVGCGDGKIDKLIMQKKAVNIEGVDVLVRDKKYISVQKYNGKVLPYEDNAFDIVMFIDVLHHIKDPLVILKEAKRVARKSVIIKDHLLEGAFAYTTLMFMDYFGNAHYEVNLPYNYLNKEQWNKYFSELGLIPDKYNVKLQLYPFPFSLIFDRNLHFYANLIVSKTGKI